jgi:hypothetical protein
MGKTTGTIAKDNFMFSRLNSYGPESQVGWPDWDGLTIDRGLPAWIKGVS